ncbi:hypothetical protein HHI36_011523 [Cryptolaemus montrouzieri]|uniref:Protein FAM177A1 n=1 Tax=Cryptolaemus montrouzieri TaxID=559131 RepID=A0ABD2MMC9_9CUCU
MTLIDPDEYKSAVDGDPFYAAIKLKTPKRVLHFSDGVLEEYSDDEIDCSPKEVKAVVDPATLSWGPWTWHKFWSAGVTTINYLDGMGEFMAAVFGITTPKYYFELEEFRKRQNEAAVDQSQRKGWSEPAGSSNSDIEFTDIRSTQPTSPTSV